LLLTKEEKMFGLFKSVTDVVAKVAEVALTPVEVVADVANAVLEPVVDAARVVKDEVKELTK
jgi:hypothetical protein